ncbi:hypothetical protein [Clostridium aceticum]|uniref:hypothetical protein n=1 Tax=Clostridium aceticum TaxID=84022 RepID=UPI00130E147C|nr:hypothetical protein [Clostridium aceticum]
MLLRSPSKAANTIIIMSAMTSILAESFDKEKEYATLIVSATTLLSLITFTILLKILL